MMAGLALIASPTLLLVRPDPLDLAPGLLLAGLGMGLISGPLAPIALSEIASAKAGAASGMLKATQELGGAIGVAAIGSFFFALAGSGTTGIRYAFIGTAAVLAALLLIAGWSARALPHNLRVYGGA